MGLSLYRLPVFGNLPMRQSKCESLPQTILSCLINIKFPVNRFFNDSMAMTLSWKGNMAKSLIPERTLRIRATIATFLQERLQARIDKLPDDDPKRSELIAQFQRTTWLEDAARRVRQIQAVTHSLKPIHPDARGTNLYVEPQQLAQHELVGSHSLTRGFAGDVVGNAAALDVYKFLKLQVDGRTLLEWLLANDEAALQALHDDAEQAREWQSAFVGLTLPREGAIASHPRAKQLYWFWGGDATADEDYHLLAPLYATSLAHAVYEIVQEHRFGESNKAARTAKRDNQAHEGVLHDYPDLAVQKLGGTKPQNISQLNSERGGNNYLLASLPPPRWQQQFNPLPSHSAKSIFSVWKKEFVVWLLSGELKAFLEAKPKPIMATRDERDDWTDMVIERVLDLAATVQNASPGWSAAAGSELNESEKLWLDPFRAEADLAFRKDWQWWDWPDQVCERFGNWLNEILSDPLPFGEVEQRHWATELKNHPSWQRSLADLRDWLSSVEKKEERAA